MIDYIRNQIKKVRAEKGLSQTDIAVDLELSHGAYSKIESGPVKLTVERLAEIATALDVNIIEFFPKLTSKTKFEDDQKKYGYANKSDIDELMQIIKQLKLEIASLKKEIVTGPMNKKKKK